MNRTINSIFFILSLFFLFPSVLNGQDKRRHYVQTRLMTEDDGSRFRETITYYNAFGFENEIVETGATPQKQDLKTLIGYDGAFRKTSESLPLPAGSKRFYNDSRPSNDLIYEQSELNRVRESYGPGEAWSENGKSVKYAYLTNSSSGVLSCNHYRAEDSGDDVKLICSGKYAPGELSVLKTTDEDGKITYSFTDYSDQLILTRQMNGEVAHDTYIVYDDGGRKRVVLPPLASDELSAANSWLCSQSEPVQLYGYVYRYDGRDRCIEKKLPGCTPIFYVYDHSDRVILKQDGNDRDAGRWQCYQYDGLGRQAIWGVISSTKTRVEWENEFRDVVARVKFMGTVLSRNNYGYTSISGLSSLCTPLIVNYYDNYNYTRISNNFIRFINRPGFYSSFSNTSLSSRDKLTGQVVALLNDPSKRDYIAFYYDQRGREIQRTTKTAFGFKNYTFTKYDFIGQPLSVRKEHTSIYRDTLSTSTDDIDHVATYDYEYDHAGRLTKLYHTYDSDPKILMAKYEYDEAGRMSKKLIHNETGTCTYKYNVRGWPTEINDYGMIEKIYYNENLPQKATPLYNGNISCLSHSTDNNYTSCFTYDELNRLISTRQYKPDGSEVFTPEDFTYDKMGNLLAYNRVYFDFYPRYMNKLTIKYRGNQIQKATDDFRSVNYYSLRYPDAVNYDVEYFYYSNGNLVKNLDNKIQRIKYNIINLPEVVAFSDRNLLTFYYMADGRKVRDTYGSYPTGTSTPLDDIVNNTDPYISGTNDWCEDYYYESGKLKRVTLPEGHISLYDNRKGPIMKYSAKDHVGSIRGYWKPGDTSLVKSYYPTYYSSGILDNKTDPYHPFALGGKELIMRNQLDEYFFGARTMYAMFNRFNQVDPLCEKYYSWSPYVYCLGNPVNVIDPDGKFPWPAIPIIIALLSESQPVNAPTLDKESNARNMEEAWNSYNEGILSDLIPVAKAEAISTRIFIQKPIEKIVRKTAGSAVQEEIGKFVPNPDGRRGGQAHRNTVNEAIKRLKADGFKKVTTEVTVRTPSGEKSRRAVDVRGNNPTTGEYKDVQVGRQNKNGTPVARERRALDDIEKATGKRPEFIPYNN